MTSQIISGQAALESGWRQLLPLLANGLLTPHEGRQFISAVMADLTSDTLDSVHKAFRSMTTALVASGAPAHRLEEWAYVLKALINGTNRIFPALSERFLSLRCMLLDAAEFRDLQDSEQAARPGVTEVIRLLEREDRPLSLADITASLDIDLHSAASRVRIGIAIGRLQADHERWETMLVSSAPAA